MRKISRKMYILRQGLHHNGRESMTATGIVLLSSALKAPHWKFRGVYACSFLGCSKMESCKQNSSLHWLWLLQLSTDSRHLVQNMETPVEALPRIWTLGWAGSSHGASLGTGDGWARPPRGFTPALWGQWVTGQHRPVSCWHSRMWAAGMGVRCVRMVWNLRETFQELNFPGKLNCSCCMLNKDVGGVYLCINYYSYIVKGVSE